MKQPALAARQFALACLVGAVLGLIYGFLRPVRRKHSAVADLLFLGAVFWGWAQLPGKPPPEGCCGLFFHFFGKLLENCLLTPGVF